MEHLFIHPHIGVLNYMMLATFEEKSSYFYSTLKIHHIWTTHPLLWKMSSSHLQMFPVKWKDSITEFASESILIYEVKICWFGCVTMWIRFEFHNTRYATVDRCCNSQNLADSALAVKFFLSIALSVVESYQDKHQIQVSDLIMSQYGLNFKFWSPTYSL